MITQQQFRYLFLFKSWLNSNYIFPPNVINTDNTKMIIREITLILVRTGSGWPFSLAQVFCVGLLIVDLIRYCSGQDFYDNVYSGPVYLQIGLGKVTAARTIFFVTNGKFRERHYYSLKKMNVCTNSLAVHGLKITTNERHLLITNEICR